MAFDNIKMDPERTAPEWFYHCKDGIIEEMKWALNIHGVPTSDPVRGALNLCEEAGEVAKEALECTRPVNSISDDTQVKIGRLEKMIAELNQTAGYAILLRCSMEGLIRRLRNGDQLT